MVTPDTRDVKRGFSHLFEHNALGVRCSSKGLLPLISQVTLLVVLVCPQLRSPVILKLTSGSKSAGLPAALS